MFDVLALACLAIAVLLLIALSVIDLKHWILPDELNLALGITGILFHFFATYRFFGIEQILMGAAAGAGLLYAIRFVANRYYGRDTLGLGDVKLLGAAGLWLGLDGTLQAITIGAFAGMLHGLAYAAYLAIKTKTKPNLSGLSIPAGPGFAVGIVAAGFILFHQYALDVMHDLFT